MSSGEEEPGGCRAAGTAAAGTAAAGTAATAGGAAAGGVSCKVSRTPRESAERSWATEQTAGRPESASTPGELGAAPRAAGSAQSSKSSLVEKRV